MVKKPKFKVARYKKIKDERIFYDQIGADF